jgi:RNA methyltransferase, TrmH family
VISSARSPKARALRRLRTSENRDRLGFALVEGPHALDSALTANAIVDTIAVTPRAERTKAALVKRAVAAGANRLRVSDEVMGSICGTATPPACVASVRLPEVTPQPAVSIAVHGMSDPAGLGAILQLCAANGWGVQVAKGSVDPFSPKVIRASNAAAWWIPVRAGEEPGVLVDEARKDGRSVVVFTSQGGSIPTPRPERVLLVVGTAAARLDGDMRCSVSTTSFPLGPSVLALEALSAWKD